MIVTENSSLLDVCKAISGNHFNSENFTDLGPIVIWWVKPPSNTKFHCRIDVAEGKPIWIVHK